MNTKLSSYHNNKMLSIGLMVYGETIATYCESQTKHKIHILVKSRTINVTEGGAYNYQLQLSEQIIQASNCEQIRVILSDALFTVHHGISVS
jgi:hypothetical protein